MNLGLFSSESKSNSVIIDQNLARRIGEGSVGKMASKWEEGEDISNLLVKHQVWCYRKTVHFKDYHV